MTDSFVTRCPHCSTRLRVTYEQISAAAGLVRCGTCLRTFNAHEYLLEGSGEAASAEIDDLLIHDDLDLHDLGLDDLNLDEELAQIEAQEQAFSKELLDLSQQIQTDGSHLPTTDDEAWAEALLREEEENHPSLALPDADIVPKDGAFWLPYKKSREEAVTPSIDWENIRVVEPGIDELPPPFPLPKKVNLLPAQEKTELKDFAQDEEETAEVLFEKPLPLRRKASFAHKALWGTLSLSAVLALGGQYLFFHFDSLMQQERYRPWLATVCSALACQMPPQADISQIRSSNLLVHSHPLLAGALMVDVVLYNHARFAQPFPLLELEFSNLAGRVLARRRFTPQQYLAGEMQGKMQIPPQIPIHIALEVKDPGNDAVNYRLSVLPAE